MFGTQGQIPSLGGLGLNQTLTSSALRMGGIGSGTSTSAGMGMGMGLGQRPPILGIGTAQQQQRPTGLGLGLNTGQTNSGLSLGGGRGLGTGGLGTGLGNKLGTGLGTTTGGLGTGLGLGAGGLGTGLGTGGLGTGLNTGLGTGLGTGIGGGGLQIGGGGGIGTQSGLGGGLGGLSLAGTQKGSAQGIFTQPNLQQPNAHQQLINSQLMLNAMTMPAIFGDERDITIQKFNQLEAYCGTGQGLTSYGGQLQAVDFTPENPFARFKTICYSQLPSSKNEDGLVALQFKKSDTDLINQKASLESSLQTIVANANVQVNIDSIKPLPDNCAEVTIYMLEHSTLGSMTRVQATLTCMYLENVTRKTQLESIGVTLIYPKTGFSEEELKLYLATPPAGITTQVWEQSKKENPNPQKYIPVAIVGSTELLRRIKHQNQECHQHELRLQIISQEIAELNQQQIASLAKISEYRRKLNDLSHRILRVMVIQEKFRKCGWSIQPVEEQLRIKLEGLYRELDSPALLKGKLNEIMSQIRMQGQPSGGVLSDGNLPMDPTSAEDIKEHLFQQQGALSEMIKIIKQDFQDLKLVDEGLKEMSSR